MSGRQATLLETDGSVVKAVLGETRTPASPCHGLCAAVFVAGVCRPAQEAAAVYHPSQERCLWPPLCVCVCVCVCARARARFPQSISLFFLCLLARLSTCLSVCLLACLFVCPPPPPLSLSLSLSFPPSLVFSVCRSASQSVCLSASPPPTPLSLPLSAFPLLLVYLFS